MKYKLIATDFDYTLANTPNLPSERTLKTLDRYMAQGGYFTICTGRMTHGVTHKMANVKINAPLICYDGAKIADYYTGKVYRHTPVPYDTTVETINCLNAKGFPFNLYYDEKLFVPLEYPFIDVYAKANDVDYHVRSDMLSFIADGKKEPTKLVCIAHENVVKQLEKDLSKLFAGKLSVTRSGAHFLELTAAAANKGNAVKFLAEMLNIPQSEVMCFGDSTNDISMIKYAGLGVCVGNGMEETKAAADLICDNCEDDGLAKIVEKYCLDEN